MRLEEGEETHSISLSAAEGEGGGDEAMKLRAVEESRETSASRSSWRQGIAESPAGGNTEKLRSFPQRKEREGEGERGRGLVADRSEAELRRSDGRRKPRLSFCEWRMGSESKVNFYRGFCGVCWLVTSLHSHSVFKLVRILKWPGCTVSPRKVAAKEPPNQ